MKKKLAKDPAYFLSKAIMENNEINIKPQYFQHYVEIDALMKKFVKSQQEYFPEKTFWADANSTLRLTYGKVEGTFPRDGMAYTWFTTLDGIIEKNNTGNADFKIPSRLSETYGKRKIMDLMQQMATCAFVF